MGLFFLSKESKYFFDFLLSLILVDTWIEEPLREVDKDFLMPIEDVFSITGRGT